MLQRDDSVNERLWIYYQNTRGLRTKIDDIFLTTRDCNFDIIILTETGLDDCINSLQLFGDSFNVFRCDRSQLNSNKRRFGGVLIAVSNEHHSSIVETVSGRCLEQVCVCATVRGKKFLICGVYVPPDRSNELETIEAHISSVSELCRKCSADETVLVCGDYNQPRICWTDGPDEAQLARNSYLTNASAALIDGMDYLNLRQANLHRNHLGRVLDLVCCSLEQQLDTDVCVAPLLPVDLHHPPLVMPMKAAEMNKCSSLVNTIGSSTALNYRKLNFDAFSDYFSNFNWGAMLANNNVDDMASYFCNTICQWLNANLPVAKRPVSPPWSSPHLREFKRERNFWQRKHRLCKTALVKQNFKRSSDAYRRLNATLYKSYVMRVQIELC
ncbi:uncharacterized protein LOC128735952 [Sabethes cyaneus]|uniref:uncharacterized protein LOC128735952 n=1 Tax=Sabethes cyaneus TaxID=53552 RepID=UPI00237DF34B|nr:uncharacterized protein LOC128735952 [Sabethes cyaneus]